MFKIQDLVEEFLFDCEAKGLSKETLKSYKFYMRKFLQFCMEKEIDNADQLNSRILKQYSTSLIKSGYEESYINTLLTVLKSLITYLVEEKYIDYKIEVKNVKEKKKIIQTFSDTELEKMLEVLKGNNYIDIRDRAIIYMLVDCGLRAGEVIKLREKDIKENNTLFIRGKGKKERFVPFSAQLKRTMLKYERVRKSFFIDKKHTPDYYFLGRYGQPLTNFIIQDVCRKVGERANITETRVFPHNFRHYYAVKNLREGLDLYSLSRLLGHSDIATTSIYTSSLRNEELFDIVKERTPLTTFNKRGGRRI